MIKAKELVMAVKPEDVANDPLVRHPLEEDEARIVTRRTAGLLQKVSAVEPLPSEDIIFGYADYQYDSTIVEICAVKKRDLLDKFEYDEMYESLARLNIDKVPIPVLRLNPPPDVSVPTYMLLFTEWNRVLGCNVSDISIKRWGSYQMGVGILAEINGYRMDENMPLLLSYIDSLEDEVREAEYDKLFRNAWKTSLDLYLSLRDEYEQLLLMEKCS